MKNRYSKNLTTSAMNVLLFTSEDVSASVNSQTLDGNISIISKVLTSVVTFFEMQCYIYINVLHFVLLYMQCSFQNQVFSLLFDFQYFD